MEVEVAGNTYSIPLLAAWALLWGFILAVLYVTVAKGSYVAGLGALVGLVPSLYYGERESKLD